MKAVTHIVLSLATYRQVEMFTRYDPTETSKFYTVRDLIYIMKSAKEVVRRS